MKTGFPLWHPSAQNLPLCHPEGAALPRFEGSQTAALRQRFLGAGRYAALARNDTLGEAVPSPSVSSRGILCAGLPPLSSRGSEAIRGIFYGNPAPGIPRFGALPLTRNDTLGEAVPSPSVSSRGILCAGLPPCHPEGAKRFEGSLAETFSQRFLGSGPCPSLGMTPWGEALPFPAVSSRRSRSLYARTFFIISSTVSRRRWSAAMSFSMTLMA